MSLNTSYADLEIRIGKQETQGYPVEITLNNEQEYEGGYLEPAFLPWVSSASPVEDGERLFSWLFASDTCKTAWAEIRGQYPQRRLRLRLDADAPELYTITWELLRDPGGPAPQDLAATTATPFSRYLAGKWQPGSPILKRPIKILLAVANPDNLVDYNLTAVEPDPEYTLLEEALAEVNDVALDCLSGPCTLKALEAALREGYHILHLVAHGKYSQRRGQTVLYLADENNQVVLVNGEELAAMLTRQLADTNAQREDKLRLVFLASCQTATHNPTDAFRAVAPALVAAGVPAVLAMQDLVPVDTTREFSRVFYRQLLAHGRVDLASNEARSSLLTGGLPGAVIPVLFMRLRSGELLGQRGRISSSNEDMFWPFLLRKIYDGQCIPILGPRVNEGLLPSSEMVAEKLADRYGYPLTDRNNLVRVAQFMTTKAPQALRNDYLQLMQRSLFRYLGLKPTPEEKRHFRDTGFSETVEALNWAEKVLRVHENQIHHLLAQLELPLYLTTNFDNFMVEALKYTSHKKGLDNVGVKLPPRRVGLRWQHARAGSPQYVLSPEPSPEEPVVFHLNGYEGDREQQEHLILAEDDFLTHLIRISRDQDTLLPSNMLGEIFHQNSFIFLGYNLEDWEFRIILQGFLKKGDTELHVGVQLANDQALDPDKVQEYLEDYFGKYNVDIYWGTPQQFVAELHARWQEYLKVANDEWDNF